MRTFYNEAEVEVEGEPLTLVLNFRAIDVIEGVTGENMTDIIPQLANPPMSLVGKVLWGMLREKHEGVTLDQAAGVGFGQDGAKVGLAMAELLTRSFNLGETEKGKNPPKRRGASKAS